MDTVGHYKIVKSVSSGLLSIGTCYTLYRSIKRIDHDWKEVYEFCDAKTNISEYKEMIEYVQSARCPALFNHSMIILHHKQSIFMLVGWKFSKVDFTHGFESKRNDQIIEKNQVKDVMDKYFGLSLEFEPLDI